jgi:AraC-like DNA-binding protein
MDAFTPTRTAPPPIRPCRMAAQWSRGEHLLFWVHAGHGGVRLADGTEHPLRSGEGVWVPAHIDRTLWTAADSVAFPTLLRPGAATAAPDRPVRFAVPDGWRDWLIQHYGIWISPITYPGFAASDVLDVLSGARPATDTHPRLPRGGPADTVARELLRNPALDHGVEQWARLVGTSPSTLLRGFAEDTGLTFAAWRARCRLAAAAEYLLDGQDVAWVAHRVGYRSRRGFSAAFRAQHGCAPSAYATTHTATPSARVTALRDDETLTQLLADASTPPTRRTVPSTHTAPRVNHFHVLAWCYRGPGSARVGDRTLQRRPGDAIWLPAGIENRTDSPEGGVGIPIGSVEPHEALLSEPLMAHFPPEWDHYLLHSSVARFTWLRPDDYDHREILRVFDTQLALQHARSVPLPQHPEAHAVATAFLRNLDGTVPTPSPAARAAFTRETDLTFQAWQNTARMRIAADLLAHGATVTEAAHRVGYTQPANFSRAFTRFHGVPPRTYRQQAQAAADRPPPAPTPD